MHIGRRVLAQAFATTGERDEVAARAQAGYERIVDEDRAFARSDWWDEFYADIRQRAR